MAVSSLHYNSIPYPMEMDWASGGQIPTYGNWDFYNGLPVSQYFDSTRQTGFHRRNTFSDELDHDLFKVVPSHLPYQYQNQKFDPRKARGAERKKVRSHHLHDRWDLKKQGRVYDESQHSQKQDQKEEVVLRQQKPRRQRIITPMAVDEDLYKIPPELLHQKPKKRELVCDFWKRCLGLMCIS